MNEMEYLQAREKMVKYQIINRDIRDNCVIEALKRVQRHLFVDEESRDYAYEDYPLAIGYGQTISQPYIVALMTEILNLETTDKVLEIGTGSGYQAAILAEIVEKVYTVERIPELQSKARDTLSNLGYANIDFLVGNGYDGWMEHAPYDKIIVTACSDMLPEKLFMQLKQTGKMIIPIGDMYIQRLMLISKAKDGKAKSEHVCYCRFVKMIDDGNCRGRIT